MKNRVKDLRLARDLTQEQLGRKLGVSRQAVNAIETERHDPSLSLAFKIAALFGKRLEEVFENPER
jgi:putative transcriptional regulator